MSELRRIEVQRTRASERVELRVRKDINHTLDRRISTKTRRCQCAAKVENVEHIHIPRATKEAADETADTAVVANNLASGGIKALALRRSNGVPLREVPERQKRREAVAELDDTEGGDDGDEAEEVWDTGGDDEGNGPVDGYDDAPQDVAGPRGERGRAEEIHEDVVVEDFDADVAVQTGCDDAREHGENVTYGLPAVGGNALVCELVRVSGVRC